MLIMKYQNDIYIEIYQRNSNWQFIIQLILIIVQSVCVIVSMFYSMVKRLSRLMYFYIMYFYLFQNCSSIVFDCIDYMFVNMVSSSISELDTSKVKDWLNICKTDRQTDRCTYSTNISQTSFYK